MSEEKLLTIRDVSLILGISEKEVIELAENGKIPAYKIGGVYLRFKRHQIEEFKKTFKPSNQNTNTSVLYHNRNVSFKDKVSDFFYFNDFYILAALIILIILLIIFKKY
ncbi:MAG: helix-turn-helix domain-containing protein [Candidatus Omnitrophica bacterium]|nr:helix-turn-helix domain-containing protein [Candidatus Omnitrophota bacterium]